MFIYVYTQAKNRIAANIRDVVKRLAIRAVWLDIEERIQASDRTSVKIRHAKRRLHDGRR